MLLKKSKKELEMTAVGRFMESVRNGIDSLANGIQTDGIKFLDIQGRTENSRKASEIARLALPVIAVLGAFYIATKFLAIVSTAVILGSVVVVSSPLWSEKKDDTFRTRAMAVMDSILDKVPGFKDYFEKPECITQKQAGKGDTVVAGVTSMIGSSDS